MARLNVQQVLDALHEWAPPSTKMDYDNVGLLVGRPEAKIERVLCCLDVTEEVVDEAMEYDYDVIVAHHPLIFKKLSRINPTDEIGRIIYKLIRNDKHLIASHTNLDAARNGVSFVLAERLDLNDISFLDTSYDIVQRLDIILSDESYNNEDHRVRLLEALDEYAHNFEVETVLTRGGQRKITAWMDDYNVSGFKNRVAGIPHLQLHVQHTQEQSPDVGMGAVGALAEPLEQDEFLRHVSTQLDLKALRYSGSNNSIQKVAVCGGAGVFLARAAAAAGADAFITGDIKYHDYFIDQDDFALIDVGHFESEFPIVPVLKDFIEQRFTELDVDVTDVVTNPMHVFTNPT
ncbi:MAG: Nif3-like dinuclear metal center hexameric protein [Bacteroidota bacterium]